MDKKTIIKNTGMLYFRMVLSTIIGLYTSRVVLEVLGVDDYGVYNVVGGIVALVGFLNAAMAGATSRFLTFELGCNNSDRLRDTFSSALIIHLSIAVLVFVLAETVGLWFLNTQLVISQDRMYAANWVYQFSVLSTMVSITQVPYNASIFSREKMDVYAYVSILNVVLKLLIVYILIIGSVDKLILYSVLIFLVSCMTASIYRIYCVRHFKECKFRWVWNREILYPLLNFSGWDMYGNICVSARLQGTNILLNMLGGTVLNAASGLAATVNGTIAGLASSIIAAFRPQIVKQYAMSEFTSMLILMNNAAKYSFLLMALFAIPLMIDMRYVMELWLREVPQYTINFCRISMISACAELLVYVVGIGIHATGKIFKISFISGTLYLLELPVMYLLLKIWENPLYVYFCHVAFVYIVLLSNCCILKSYLKLFSISRYLKHAVLIPMILIMISSILPFLIYVQLEQSFLRLIFISTVSVCCLGLSTYWIALDREMREKIKVRFLEKLKRKRFM